MVNTLVRAIAAGLVMLALSASIVFADGQNQPDNGGNQSQSTSGSNVPGGNQQGNANIGD